MSFVRKLKRAIRGEVSPKTATLEILRRTDAAIKARNERNSLASESKQPAHLCRPYSDLNDEQLLEHFNRLLLRFNEGEAVVLITRRGLAP